MYGRREKMIMSDRTRLMCAHVFMNPGLPEQQFDSFDSDKEVADPVEDEHCVTFDTPEYTYARKQFLDLLLF